MCSTHMGKVVSSKACRVIEEFVKSSYSKAAAPSHPGVQGVLAMAWPGLLFRGGAGGKGLYHGGGKHICATRTADDILAGILWATDGAQKVTHFGLL